MKKIILAMVTLTMVVVSANAASVAWSTGNLGTLSVNSGQTYATDWQGQTATFYLVAAGYDLTGVINGLKNNDMSVLTGLTTDGSGVLSGSTKYQATATGTKTTFGSGNTAYGFALIFDKNSSITKGTVDFAISKVVGGTFSLVNLPINFGGAAGFTTYDVVPEPTSMALLALGVAAMGLRRRFKK